MSHIKKEFTVQELLNYLAANEGVKTNRYNSHNDDKDFRGTASFEEALELVQYGSRDILEKLHKELALLKGAPTKEVSYRPDIEGLFFDVARVLEGEPEAWYKPSNKEKKHRLEVVVSATYSAGVEVYTIIHNSALLISYIKDIEAKGVEVRLVYNYSTKYSKNRSSEYVVLIKDYQEPFNYNKISGTIHPSFFRRLIFRATELTYPTDLDGGYGRSVESSPLVLSKESTIREYFETPNIKEM